LRLPFAEIHVPKYNNGVQLFAFNLLIEVGLPDENKASASVIENAPVRHLLCNSGSTCYQDGSTDVVEIQFQAVIFTGSA